MTKIRAALVGLGFGGAFVPIWRDHPDVESVALFDTNQELCKRVAEHHGIEKIYSSFEELLADDTLDAVHLVSPIPLHEEQTVAVLRSGKHCACTVPMATSLEGLQRITDAVRESGKNYMMMETTLYTRHFHYVKKMIETGEMGQIQFLRGSHYQDMENWPSYWDGLPPMWYGTHAIGPLVALAGARAKGVFAYGSGSMREELVEKYNNPFPVETALFNFENGMKAEATRSLFETARVYQEGLFVYGSKASFEWGFQDDSRPIVSHLVDRDEPGRGLPVLHQEIDPPNVYANLPQEIQRYTVSGDDYDETNPQDSLSNGAAGGHHGSHPHLVHEFVRSIVEKRKPAIDEGLGANITAAGICAHISAMRGGEYVEIPQF